MAGFTEASQVIDIQPQVRTFGNLDDVVNFDGRLHEFVFQAIFAQWIALQFQVPSPSPGTIVATRGAGASDLIRSLAGDRFQSSGPVWHYVTSSNTVAVP